MRMRHRLSRLERLEPRVVLDGGMTGGLAIVPADSPVTIRQPDSSLFRDFNVTADRNRGPISFVPFDQTTRLADDKRVFNQRTSSRLDRIFDDVLTRPTTETEIPDLATNVPFVGARPLGASIIPLPGSLQLSDIVIAESSTVRSVLDRAESAADAIASRSQIAIAANPASGSATSTKTDADRGSPTLSEHAYFKQATSRRSVNWSIQSAASESRSHGPTTDSSIDISHAADSMASGSIVFGSNFFDRIENGIENGIEQWNHEVANLPSALVRLIAIAGGSTFRFSGMPSATPQLVALQPTSTDHSDDAPTIEPVLFEPPISILVTASLASAYLIDDRKIDDQKQRKRNGNTMAER